MASKITIPMELLAQFDLVVSMIPEIDRKGVTSPYTSLNGHMFSMMRKDGVLGIRLNKVDREIFLEKYDTVPFKNYGSMIKDYVEIPREVLMDTDVMVCYMKRSHEYTKTLKPKDRRK